MVVLAFGLAGCGGAPSDAGDDPAVGEKRNVNVDPQLEPFVSQAKRDLAGRLEIEESEVTLLDAGFVTWPNGALGCPEPDMMYTQALVPGYRIQLRAEDTLHHYHGAGDKSPFHCPAERVTKTAPGGASGDARVTGSLD